MINTKDVVTLRIPYPDVVSELAEKSHMYVCIEAIDPSCELAKCQTFKAYHKALGSYPLCRVVEYPDVTRNPFKHPTLIDLDKLFVATRSLFPDELKTAHGINDALLADIKANLSDTADKINLSDTDLKAVNYKM